MKIKTNQKGFSAVEILLILFVVGLISGIGLYVSQLKNKTDNVVDPASTQQQSANQASKSDTQSAQNPYLTLNDFKVRIPLNDKISKLKLAKVSTSIYSESDKSVSILAPELDSVWKCAADPDGSKGSIGTISVSTQTKRSGPYEPLTTKKVGSYTYGFEAGGSNCIDSPLYQELVDAFKAQFDQLQAY